MENNNSEATEKNNRHFEFLIEEYRALREEIDSTVAHLRRIVYLNVIGCGAIWYFILDAKNRPHRLLYWLPLILCTLCGLYVLSLRRDLHRFGRYIQKLEKELLKPDSTLGWEHFLITVPKDLTRHTHTFESISWMVLMFLNLLGAITLQG